MPAQGSVLTGTASPNGKKNKLAKTILFIHWVITGLKDNMIMMAEALKEGEIMKPDERGPPVGKPRTSEKYSFSPDPKTTLCGCLELHGWKLFTRCSIVDGKYVDHPLQDQWIRIYKDAMPADHGAKIVRVMTDLGDSIKDRTKAMTQSGVSHNHADWTHNDNQKFEVRLGPAPRKIGEMMSGLDICELILTDADFRVAFNIDACMMMAIEGTAKADVKTNQKIDTLNKTMFPIATMDIRDFMKERKGQKAAMNGFMVPDGTL